MRVKKLFFEIVGFDFQVMQQTVFGLSNIPAGGFYFVEQFFEKSIRNLQQGGTYEKG